jgi:hypothetical protein
MGRQAAIPITPALKLSAGPAATFSRAAFERPSSRCTIKAV